tara:strand:+ start:133 stop:342 length:210 start_codon:yes stop_codon:yes gene_type:complete
MTEGYNITVKSDRPKKESIINTHCVTGKGDTRIQTFCSAVGQIAEAFPQSKGHSIVAAKSDSGTTIRIK